MYVYIYFNTYNTHYLYGQHSSRFRDIPQVCTLFIILILYRYGGARVRLYSVYNMFNIWRTDTKTIQYIFLITIIVIIVHRQQKQKKKMTGRKSSLRR